MAYEIKNKLKEKNIYTYLVDLEELIYVDHVVLIAEYKEDNQLKKLLIDPTFSQFIRPEKSLDIAFYPGDRIVDKIFLNNLLVHGVVDIDNNSFNMYLNAFTKAKNNVDLNSYLIDVRLEEMSSNNKIR